jgi:ribosomal protein S18 acetylase RimI-like enzyme
MRIRPATHQDLDQIWQLRLETTELLKTREIDQWQYVDPKLETFKKDIDQHEFFVAEEHHEIIGMIAIKSGIEHTYDVIYDGKWHYDLPYLTIHRLAVKKDRLGTMVSNELLIFADQLAKDSGIGYIRIDTHEKNKYAIRLFESFNYVYGGWILLVQAKGDLKRLAFDKKL